MCPERADLKHFDHMKINCKLTVLYDYANIYNKNITNNNIQNHFLIIFN